MKLTTNSKTTGFKDDAKVSSWARELVAAVAQEGYIKGWNGYFRPGDNITRGEAAALIAQAAGQLYNEPGEYDGKGQAIDGNVTISVSGVILKDTIINGNLYITEGVGAGEAKLDNSQVKGKTLISGGGLNSIYLFKSNLGIVIINVPDGSPVRVVSDDSQTTEINVRSSAEIEVTGTSQGLGGITINAPVNANITLIGDFGNVTINSSGAVINIPAGSSVQTLNVGAGANVTGTGVIQNAIISANGVVIEAKPVNTTLIEGVTANINGQNISGSQASPPSSNSSGSSDITPPRVEWVDYKIGLAAGRIAELDNTWDFNAWYVYIPGIPEHQLNNEQKLTITLSEPVGPSIVFSNEYKENYVFTQTSPGSKVYEYIAKAGTFSKNWYSSLYADLYDTARNYAEFRLDIVMGNAQRISDPVLLLSSIYDIEHAPQTVSLSCATEGATIYYTLDNSNPRKSGSSKSYAGSFRVDELTNIKFFATKEGHGDSKPLNSSIDVYYLTDIRKAEVDASKLIISGVDLSNVTADLVLPMNGLQFGSTITWESSKPLLIADNGKVTRPDGKVDMPVKMTATINFNGMKTYKYFDLLVKAKDLALDEIVRELPALAYDSDQDRYLCVYKRGDKAHTAAETGIYGRFVGPDGNFNGNEFVIASSATIGTFSPTAVAYDSKLKRFLVAWDDSRDNGTDGQWNVYGQFVSAAGARLGEIFPISDITEGKEQSYPGIAFDSVNGNFLIIYNHQVDWHDQQGDLHCRLIYAAGNLGADKLIVGGQWGQYGTNVDFNGTNFLVAYGDSGNKIKFVMNDGTPDANSFTLSTGEYMGMPKLAYNAKLAKFMTVWSTRYVGSSTQWIDDICGSLIEQAGSSGNYFVIADQTKNQQFYPAVAAVDTKFAVVWMDATGGSNIRAALVADDQTLAGPFVIADSVGEPRDSLAVCGGKNEALLAYEFQMGNDPINKEIRIKVIAADSFAISFVGNPVVSFPGDKPPVVVNFTANQAGTAYYIVTDKDAYVPANAQTIKSIVKSEGDTPGILVSGKIGYSVDPKESNSFDFTYNGKMYAAKDYDLYIVLESALGAFSEVKNVAFHTPIDTTPPVFIKYGNPTGVSQERSRAFIINQSVEDYDEYYDLYVQVVQTTDPSGATPAAADVISNGKKYEKQQSGYSKGNVITYTGLTPATYYYVHLVAQDNSAGKLASVVESVYSQTTVDINGPNWAGGKCYTLDQTNKTLKIQFDGDLDDGDISTLKTHIKTYPGSGASAPLASGDEVEISKDTMTITFAVLPSDGFQLYIDQEAIAYKGNPDSKNIDQLSLSISLE